MTLPPWPATPAYCPQGTGTAGVGLAQRWRCEAADVPVLWLGPIQSLEYGEAPSTGVCRASSDWKP